MNKTYSQSCQDLFVYTLLGNDGYFLDLGAGWDDTGLNSNTLLLEENGWDGVCIEGDGPSAKRRQDACIRSKVLNVFIPQKSLKEILKEEDSPKIIDYVSIDIDPVSIVALKDFPLDDFEFKVLTFEHDCYRIGIEQKSEASQILLNKGYVRLCNDVLAPSQYGDNCYFEDWWINPKYFSSDFIRNNFFDKKPGYYIIENIKK